MSGSVCGTKVAVCLVLLRVWYSVTLPRHKLSLADGDRHEDLVAPVGSLSRLLKVHLLRFAAYLSNSTPPPFRGLSCPVALAPTLFIWVSH